MFKLFGKKSLGHYTDITIEGLDTTYDVRRRNSQASEPFTVRILLANDDAVYTVYGVSHSPYVSAISVEDENGEKVPAIMLSNTGRKKLKVNELQILVDYEMMRWSSDVGRAWTNSQPGTTQIDPDFPEFFAVYEASTKTRKLQLVAENKKVAQRAFLKNEKSLLTLPKEAYKSAENFKRQMLSAAKAEEVVSDVVDLAGAVE